MAISSKAKAYKSYDGKWVLFGDGIGFGHRDVYYSPDDGKTFFQLDRNGWGNRHANYEDPHHQTGMEIFMPQGEDYIREVTPTGLGRIYRHVNLPAGYKIVLLPHVRLTRYFFCMLNGEGIIYVSSNKYYPEEPLRIYFGTIDLMKKLKIVSLSYQAISTDLGLLETGGYLPTWEGLQLMPLSTKKYIFIETADGLTIETK